MQADSILDTASAERGVVRADDADSQQLVARQQRAHGVAGQYPVDRFGVVQVFQVQRIRQLLPVAVIALNGDDSVEPVHAQLQGGVYVDADGKRRGEVEPATAEQEQRQTRQGGEQAPAADGPRARVAPCLSVQIRLCARFNASSACTLSSALWSLSFITVTSQLLAQQLLGTGQERVNRVHVFP